MKPRLALVFLLALPLAVPAPAVAARTEALQTFTESGGCKLLGSKASVTRQKEIATQGSVTWEGRCVEGYIDGPGVLRHQGVVLENGRTRRYAFYLTGVARAGMRTGEWRRESFNMFDDTGKYWTSLATLNYVDGAAKGATRFGQVRGNDDFTPPFRRLLAGIDRELAAAQPRHDPAAGGNADAGAGSPAARAPAPPSVAAAPAASAIAPVAPIAAPAEPRAAAAEPRLAAAPPAPPSAASGGKAGPPEAREGSLKLLAAPGTRLPPPAPPATPQQQILEQRGACSVEQINGRVVGEETIDATASQPIRVVGWAADPRKPQAPEQPRIPEQAWLRFYNRGGGPGLLLDMPRNAERPDVARALGHPVYARAGFHITVDPGKLKPGDYTVAILQGFGADVAICSSIGRLSLK